MLCGILSIKALKGGPGHCYGSMNPRAFCSQRMCRRRVDEKWENSTNLKVGGGSRVLDTLVMIENDFAENSLENNKAL